MRIADTALLRCPTTGSPLSWQGTNLELMLADGSLRSSDGAQVWPVVDGLPQLCRDAEVGAVDLRMRHIHDRLPRVHRPLLRLALPLLQGGGSEGALQQATREALNLDHLGAKPRVLEVGVGDGGNLPWLLRALPADAEVWGLDLSEVLLRRCRQRWASHPFREHARLLMADAHNLPFADGAFDRVFHLGGLGRFQDPSRVLAELVRVTAPGGFSVLVGKRLDPREPAAPPVAAAFRLLTLWEPEVPFASLGTPPGAASVEERQVSRFFASLTVRKLG